MPAHPSATRRVRLRAAAGLAGAVALTLAGTTLPATAAPAPPLAWVQSSGGAVQYTDDPRLPVGPLTVEADLGLEPGATGPVRSGAEVDDIAPTTGPAGEHALLGGRWRYEGTTAGVQAVYAIDGAALVQAAQAAGDVPQDGYLHFRVVLHPVASAVAGTVSPSIEGDLVATFWLGAPPSGGDQPAPVEPVPTPTVPPAAAASPSPSAMRTPAPTDAATVPAAPVAVPETGPSEAPPVGTVLLGAGLALLAGRQRRSRR